LSDGYSHADLPLLKRSLKGRAFIYLSLDRSRRKVADPSAWYREVMELMAPDVLVVPVVTEGSVEEARELCARFAPIAREYAARMEWGWADPVATDDAPTRH